MKVYTTGEACRLLGIRMHRLFYLEEAGQIPRARRTGTSKRYFTEADIQKLRETLASTRLERTK